MSPTLATLIRGFLGLRSPRRFKAASANAAYGSGLVFLTSRDAKALEAIEPDAVANQREQKETRANVEHVATDEASFKAPFKSNELPVAHGLSKHLGLSLHHHADLDLLCAGIVLPAGMIVDKSPYH